jgi:hypothetical protein
VWAAPTPQGKYLVINLAAEIEFQNFILENTGASANERPEGTSDGVLHTNSSHQPPLLYQGLSTSLAKGLGT